MKNKNKKAPLKTLPSITTPFRAAQDDQFNRFNTFISLNRGGYTHGNGNATQALFQLPQPINALPYVCVTEETEVYSVKLKRSGEKEAISQIIDLKNERLAAVAKGEYVLAEPILTPIELLLLERYLGDEKSANALFLFVIAEILSTPIHPCKKLTQVLNAENTARNALLTAEINALKKNQADIKNQAVFLKNEKKLRNTLLTEETLFFKKLSSAHKKPLQIELALKQAADATTAVYLKNESALNQLIADLNHAASQFNLRLASEIAFGLSMITKAFSHFLNKANAVPIAFIVLIHYHSHFFLKKLHVIQSDADFKHVAIHVDNIKLIEKLLRDITKSYTYLHYFDSQKNVIQQIIACYIFVEARLMDQSAETYYAKDTLLTLLFDQSSCLLQLLFVKTITDCMLDRATDEKTALFNQAELAYQAVLNRLTLLYKTNRPHLSILGPCNTILAGKSHMETLKQFEKATIRGLGKAPRPV